MTRGKTRLSGKNLLFAELIIVILFFSIASAGCVLLFAEAYSDGKQSRDLTNAVIMAQNDAEIIKASDGDPQSLAELLIEAEKGIEHNNGLEVLLEKVDEAFIITVFKDELWDGEIIFSLTVGVIP